MHVATDATCPLRSVLLFHAQPSELGSLRRTVQSILCCWGASLVADEVGLAVTELATNVIKHVGQETAATLVLEAGTDGLRVEMHDRSRVVPTMAAIRGLDAESGRGLQVLSGLSLDWGTLLTPTGKAVWCEIPLASIIAHASVARAAAVLGSYRKGAAAPDGSPGTVLLEQSATALIADVLHWAGAHGKDADEVLDRAQTRYEQERGMG